ncbi:MAG: hypothetical protein U1E60_00550 [Reyranellaceae bacterium]
MVSARVLAAAGLGLVASACGYSETTYVRPAPAAVAYDTPAPVTTTYVTPAPAVATTTYYTPSPPISTEAAAYPATSPPIGVQTFRDEYGFRYDGRGNRIDRYGNVISPYSTRP